MSNKEDQVPVTWSEVFKDIVAGGAPAILAGPAGKALSQLIGSVIDIPVAWLEGFASRIRDETKARSVVMEALAAKSAELGVSDPNLLNRGLTNLLGRAYKEQENKEAIARKTLEHLVEEPPPSTSEGPSDDFMNAFIDYAGKATSDNVRETWSRVLAGEIRKPGSVSLGTMQFLSTIDQEMTRELQTVLSFAVDDRSIVPPNTAYDYTLRTAVAERIILQTSPNLDHTYYLNPGPRFITRGGDQMLAVQGTGEFRIRGYIELTRRGRELLDLVRPKASKQVLEYLIAEISRTPSVSVIFDGPIHREPDGRRRILSPQVIWKR